MYTSQTETPTTSSYAESTKYVADILSSMANGGVETNTFVPNFLISSGTGLTPTLTPTTLATIEQSFMEMQHSGARDPVTQSGFVPPVVESANSNSADHSQDSFDTSASDPEWEPKPKKFCLKDGVKGVDYIVTSTGTVNVTPQRKYTRRNKDEKLAPEEEEKRRVRRERNKVAAAKCRQRRVDHTNELVDETDELIAIQNRLESEIQSLKQERDQLEFILQSHQPLCKVSKGKVKAEQNDNRHQACSSPHTNRHNLVPENLSKSSNAGHTNSLEDRTNENSKSTVTTAPATTSSLATARPNSLPLIKRDRARMLSMTSATGVTINTPTSGVSITPSMLFCPGLDAMVDGSTGLTPITGMSCSSQVQNRGSSESNSNNENVGSPTLISL